MTARVHLGGDLPAYRVAIAGLPRSATSTDTADGAIVVVDGAGAWWHDLRRAADAGSIGIVVDDPGAIPDEAKAVAVEVDVPIVVRRTRLRPGTIELATRALAASPPRSVVAECQVVADDAVRSVGDAVGWLRILSGGAGAASIRRGAGGRHGGTTLLRWATAAPASLITTVSASGPGLLRVRALGETSVEVDLDDRMGRRRLTTATAAGRLVAPSFHEQPEREALRRAIDVAARAVRPTDLDQLVADHAAARAILEA